MAAKIDPFFKRLLGATMILIALIVTGASCSHMVAGDMLWANGEHTTEVDLMGQKRTGRSSSLDVNITFRDKQGGTHQGRVRFWTVGGLSTRDDPEVAYNPRNPKEFVLNWEVNCGIMRIAHWLIIAVLLIIGAVKLLRSNREP